LTRLRGQPPVCRPTESFRLRDSERLELRGNVRPGGLWLHLLVDVEDLPFGADVERPPAGQSDGRNENAVGAGDRLVGIRENRVVAREGVCELLVGGSIVGGDGEVDRVELADRGTALTERLALGGSAAGEGLRKPREDDGLSLELGKIVDLAVGALQLERRRRVPGPQLRGTRPARDRRHSR